jgi:replicative DNA helicase
MNALAAPPHYLELPHNASAEKQFLAALLAGAFSGKNDLVKRYAKSIDPTDFFKQGAQNFYSRILELDSQGRAIDECMLVDSFKNDPNYHLYRDYADELEPVTSGLAAHFGKIVLEYSLRRKAIQKVAETLEKAQDLSLPLEEVLTSNIHDSEEIIERGVCTCL